MKWRAVIVAIIAAISLSCGTSAPVTQTKILEAGACWYETTRCKSKQFGDRTLDICIDEWQARCREAELERYLRLRPDGKPECSLVRMANPRMIAVACGGPK